jgi:hypothetical protein
LGASRAVAAARRSGRCGFSLCWYRSGPRRLLGHALSRDR